MADTQSFQTASMDESLTETTGHCVWFRTIKCFVVCMCIVQLFVQCFITGYLPPVLPTLERQYTLSSFFSGVINSAYDVSGLLLVLLVSYFGSSRHIPRWVGSGTVVIVTGLVVFTLPQFLLEPPHSIESSNTSIYCNGMPAAQPGSDCDASVTVQSKSIVGWAMFFFLVARTLMGVGGTPYLTLGTAYVDNHVPKEASGIYLAPIYACNALGPVFGFLLGGSVLNIYVNIKAPAGLQLNSPNWVGAWWIGFLGGAACLLLAAIPFYLFPRALPNRTGEPGGLSGIDNASLDKRSIEDGSLPRTDTASSLKQKDSGFSDLGTGTNDSTGGASTAASDTATTASQSSATSASSLSSLPRDAWQLLTNPVFMFVSLGSSFEMAIIGGFIPFLAKYVMVQFYVDNAFASKTAGGLAVTGAVLGVLVGGIITKKMELTPWGAIRYACCICALALSMFSLLFVLGCNNSPVAGVTVPYDYSVVGPLPTPRELLVYAGDETDGAVKVPLGSSIKPLSLTAPCNQNCSCRTENAYISCGVNGLTYVSPCFAGCVSHDEAAVDYLHENISCACVKEWLEKNSSVQTEADSRNPWTSHWGVDWFLKDGFCVPDCAGRMFWPFIVVLTLLCFVISTIQMPLLMVTMRSVPTHIKSFSLGFQFLIMRILGSIPSPMFFGMIIDSTCIQWRRDQVPSHPFLVADPAETMWCPSDGDQSTSGDCLIYDLEQFRFRFIGFLFGLKLLAFVSFLVTCFFIRRRDKLDESRLSFMTMSSRAAAAGGGIGGDGFEPATLGELLASLASVNSMNLELLKPHGYHYRCHQQSAGWKRGHRRQGSEIPYREHLRKAGRPCSRHHCSMMRPAAVGVIRMNPIQDLTSPPVRPSSVKISGSALAASTVEQETNVDDYVPMDKARSRHNSLRRSATSAVESPF